MPLCLRIQQESPQTNVCVAPLKTMQIEPGVDGDLAAGDLAKRTAVEICEWRGTARWRGRRRGNLGRVGGSRFRTSGSRRGRWRGWGRRVRGTGRHA